MGDGLDTLATVDVNSAKKVVQLIYEWTANLGKRDAFSDTLAQLRTVTHAVHAAVFRKCRTTRRRICIAGRNSAHGKALSGSGQLFADNLLGEDLFLLRKGEVHLLTDAAGISASELRAKTGYTEIIICILDGDTEHIDLLELQYRARPLECDLMLLQIQASTFAQAWKCRHSGAVRTMIKGNELRVAHDRSSDAVCAEVDVLSTKNPMRLTRAEFRICSLIQGGMMTSELLVKLHISQNTFRSHMRSIYLKTGTRGQVELLHMLHGKLSA